MPAEKILLMGVNHKTTPVEVREKIALSNGYEAPLTALRGTEGLREYYLLSTCNRVEFLLVVDDREAVEDEIIRFLFGEQVDKNKCLDYLYILRGNDAVHHLFMVAASLDSMIVGEAQILGQLKEAYRHAAGLGTTGPLLNKLLHKSFSVAKRVRTETAIGSAAVSISYAAVQLAKKIFGNITEKKVLLIGAGEMAELAAEHLVGQGVKKVVVANRTLSRAVDLAKRFHGSAVSIEELVGQLEFVDIIISSTGATDIILHRDEVKSVMRARMNKPLFFIDIAVPRDLDPGLNDLENVYLYDIDDLKYVVEMNKTERDKEAVKATRIVDEETLKFERYYQSLAVAPTIQELREMIEQISRAELAKTVSKIESISAKDKQRLEKMALAIGNKIMHNPLMYLKNNSCAGRDRRDQKVSAVRELFGLGNSSENE
ncbi:glutamyl-tRNA reductase [Desulforhopalus singaporensis]|uniref:Glutamyl-tRNA reductase n=1 Tax=Desulforhopalus singaporensis TaxID=91360 RepID=A0A1H0NC24_9BACT|nr:glutamyl-tRNA reductase [Desulforhopalus singaporensis]SDO90262.1 glutamyl-tRNA reductase [Desulforhopalus singaporensis]